jgi:hypothetical protein
MPTTRTANGTSTPSDMTGQVLAEAARRMVPVLTGKLLTAIADQAVARVDGLADRLDDYRDHGPAGRAEPRAAEPDEADEEPRPSMASTALAFLAEQLRTVLATLVRLAAQALEMLRRATERLRARRAPEGIDAEAEALEQDDEDEGEGDGDIEGEYDLEYDDEDDEGERAAG